ncbi:MAG: hypothetical protein ACE5HS_20310 [bacterium]
MKKSSYIFLIIILLLIISFLFAKYITPIKKYEYIPSSLSNNEELRVNNERKAIYKKLLKYYEIDKLGNFENFKKLLDKPEKREIIYELYRRKYVDIQSLEDFNSKVVPSVDKIFDMKKILKKEFNYEVFWIVTIFSLLSIILILIIIRTYSFFIKETNKKRIIAFEVLWIIVTAIIAIIFSILADDEGFLFFVTFVISYMLQGLIWSFSVLFGIRKREADRRA